MDSIVTEVVFTYNEDENAPSFFRVTEKAVGITLEDLGL